MKLLRILTVCAALTFSAMPAIARPDSDLPTTEAVVSTGADDYGDDHQLLVMLRLPATHYRPDATYGGRYIDDNSRSARQRRAEALARQHGLTLVEGWPMAILGIDCYVMRYPDSTDADHLIAQLSRDPQVEWAQPVARFDGMAQSSGAGRTTDAKNGDAMTARAGVTATAKPGGAAEADASGDPLYSVQPAARYWHLAELHRYTRGRGITVAVVDSGIDASHPDLHGQLDVNNNFVDAGPTPAENHGTAVAGIIAARVGGGGIIGVAPQARLMGLRACWQQRDLATRCNSFTLSKAINFAILNGAQVINLSLSGPPDRLLDRLLDVALERGISVVGAIDPHATSPTFPASHHGVLAVASQARSPLGAASVTPEAQATSAASSGTAGLRSLAATIALAQPGSATRAGSDASPALSAEPHLLAPGNDIPTSAPGARWAFVSGSSYAAAHVSGMLALLDELRPDSSPAQMRTLLQSGAALHAATIDACTTIARLVRDLRCARQISQHGAAP
ncbi:S8 family peptidase [Duganella margarita]